GHEGEHRPPPDPLPVPALDSHCHLDLMGTPVTEALAQARAVGVTRVVQVGIDVPSSRWSAQTAAEYEAVLATVALHPNQAPRLAAKGELDGALDEIDRLAELPRGRGGGEAPLGYFPTRVEGQAAQQEALRRHTHLATRQGLALVIHDRDAHGDVLRILAEEGAPERVVFHCFSGDAELARVCSDRGYIMSFAGNITFKNAQSLRDAVAVAPLDQILA